MAEILGLDDLSKKLAKLGVDTGIKKLGKSVKMSIDPVFAEIRLSAPAGREPHKSYKGRPLAAGYTRRSLKLKRRTSKRHGRVRYIIAVDPEAFYSVQFIDPGIAPTQRKGKPIKPYTIKARRWFRERFWRDRQGMLIRFEQSLKREAKLP